MKYVRSFKGRKKGGRFPKGKPSEWRAKAKKGSAKERAKFKRAIANWDKLMSQPGFKQKWNSNKIKKGGALEENINYRQLINMYQEAQPMHRVAPFLAMATESVVEQSEAMG